MNANAGADWRKAAEWERGSETNHPHYVFWPPRAPKIGPEDRNPDQYVDPQRWHPFSVTPNYIKFTEAAQGVSAATDTNWWHGSGLYIRPLKQ
jgi:hypothetical protein